MTVSAIAARRLMEQPVVMPLSGNDARGDQFIGRSASMLEVFKSIGRVSGSNVTVLIRGESGCGKELVARAILQHSDRHGKPYTAVNCAAIPDQLLENELFGHEKGAFTGADQRRKGKFEQCHGGTIFLDEVGDMSLLIQGKVLRLIQDQRFQRLGSNDEIATDVRVIAATNRNLEEMVKKGKFREDLLYRLNGYTIELPPLRDRRDDIPQLLEYFLKRERREMGKMSLEGLAPAALDALIRYDWPGNVRQLQSVIRHALLHTTGTVLSLECLPTIVFEGKDRSLVEEVTQHMSEVLAPATIAVQPTSGGRVEEASRLAPDIGSFVDGRLLAGSTDLYNETIEEVERYLFACTLSDTHGNQSKAADILGITRGKVRDRIAYFGIQLERAVTIQS
jgi:two-component system nitrogen regulation response regulator GlnG